MTAEKDKFNTTEFEGGGTLSELVNPKATLTAIETIRQATGANISPEEPAWIKFANNEVKGALLLLKELEKNNLTNNEKRKILNLIEEKLDNAEKTISSQQN